MFNSTKAKRDSHGVCAPPLRLVWKGFLESLYSRKRGTLSMWSGTVFGQESPCGRRCGQLRILLQSQLGQEGVVRRRDHVPRFVDKEIEK